MAAPTTGTPLEEARRDREEMNRQLMGFGNSPIAKADLAQMQEIQNLFNAHKQTGARLLQEGRITSEEYYANTRKAGIKLGIIRPDEYPDDLPSYLKPTLEIGGAVIGGVLGGLAGLPGGIGGSLAGESIGAGLGSAAGTLSYAFLQDITAPDGMPTSSWDDRGVADEALREGAVVTGLTAGIGGIIRVGGAALKGRKIMPKAVENLSNLGKERINSILNSPQAEQLKRMKNGYLIEEQQKADDLMKFLREQGITPNLSMVIDNDTVRSLVYALGRTPLLGKPARDAYDKAKFELFDRIAVGVKTNDLDKALAPLVTKFERDGKSIKLRDGVELDQVSDMGAVVNFLNRTAGNRKNVATLYSKAEEEMKKQTFTKEMFDDTANLWRNFNTAGIGVENQSKNGRVLKDLLSQETNEMAEILFGNPITQGVVNFTKRQAAIAEKHGKGRTTNIFVKSSRDDPGQGVPIELTASGLAELVEKKFIVKNLADDAEDAYLLGIKKGQKGDIDKIRDYTVQNINNVKNSLNAKTKDGVVVIETTAGKAFKELSLPEQIIAFKNRIKDDYADASYLSNRASATTADLTFTSALRTLNDDISTKIINNSNQETVRIMRQADAAYQQGIDDIVNNYDIIKRVGYYRSDVAGKEGAKVAAILAGKKEAAQDVLDGPLQFGQVNKTGDILDSSFKTKRVAGPNYYEYVKSKPKPGQKEGDLIPLTRREQLQVPGVSPQKLDQIIGREALSEGDVVERLFTQGTPAELKQFKKTVGDVQFRKAVVAQFETDVNDTIIRFINGKEGEAAAALQQWFKRIGVGDAEKTRRYSTMIDEAGLAFKYDDLVQMTKMMELLPSAPALNQFIQRSMMLRFSQGIAPSAIGGLFGGGLATAGGSVGIVGAGAGLGVLYMFNRLMASSITKDSVSGMIAGYKEAIKKGNKKKADEISKRFVGLGSTVMTPFMKISQTLTSTIQSPITPQLVKQSAINLGAAEYFE